jgi:hypothetical protein
MRYKLCPGFRIDKYFAFTEFNATPRFSNCNFLVICCCFYHLVLLSTGRLRNGMNIVFCSQWVYPQAAATIAFSFLEYKILLADSSVQNSL